MLFSAVGAPTTLSGMLGGTTSGFGLKIPGAGGAAAVASSKIFRTTGMCLNAHWKCTA